MAIRPNYSQSTQPFGSPQGESDDEFFTAKAPETPRPVVTSAGTFSKDIQYHVRML